MLRKNCLTVFLEESPHKRVNTDKLELNIIAIKGDPFPIRQLLDYDAVLLQHRAPLLREKASGNHIEPLL